MMGRFDLDDDAVERAAIQSEGEFSKGVRPPAPPSERDLKYKEFRKGVLKRLRKVDRQSHDSVAGVLMEQLEGLPSGPSVRRFYLEGALDVVGYIYDFNVD